MLRSPAWSLSWNILRLVVAAAIVSAVVAQFSLTVTRAIDNGQDVGTIIANFFSFFTILSNTLTAAVLVWAALWFFTAGRSRLVVVDPRGLATALASVTTYMIITGIVYNTLLRGIELPQGSEPIPWSNEILHLAAPLFLLLDALFAPARRGQRWSTVALIAVFPIVWVVYTLVRAPLVTNPATGGSSWYPYPFLDPANFDNGYGGVAVYILAIAAAIIAVGFFVVWVGRARADKRADDEVGDPRLDPVAEA